MQKAATKEKIFAAFFEEYQTTPLRSITVGAISRRAGINRTTFYDYFTDVYDLLEQAQISLLEDITGHLQGLTRENLCGENNLLPHIGEVILSKYGQRIGLLLKHGDTGFSQKLIGTMTPVMSSTFGIVLEDDKGHLLISYVLSGITGFIGELYDSDSNLTTAEATAMLQSLMASSVLAFYKMQQ